MLLHLSENPAGYLFSCACYFLGGLGVCVGGLFGLGGFGVCVSGFPSSSSCDEGVAVLTGTVIVKVGVNEGAVIRVGISVATGRTISSVGVGDDVA